MCLSVIIGLVGAAVLLSWAIVAILIRYALRIGLIDRPNERSLHQKVTPRGGGLGVVVVWSIGLIACWYFRRDWGMSFEARNVVLLLSALVVAGVSLWDDFCNIGAGIRFVFHLVCAAVIMAAFGWYEKVDVGSAMPLGPMGMFITASWIVGLTNVYNFMDGIDGIAGLQGLIAGFGWFFAGLYLDIDSIIAMGALLAGGSAGFLLHNWSPAKIFMGDVGSAFLGFVFGSLPLIVLSELPRTANSQAVERLPFFAVSVVWPFFADGTFTFLRRLLNREQVWKPHRSHLYQRLVQTGCSHAAVALYYGFWAAICSGAGLFFLRGGGGTSLWIVWVLFAVLTWTLTFYLEHKNRHNKGAHSG